MHDRNAHPGGNQRVPPRSRETLSISGVSSHHRFHPLVLASEREPAFCVSADRAMESIVEAWGASRPSEGGRPARKIALGRRSAIILCVRAGTGRGRSYDRWVVSVPGPTFCACSLERGLRSHRAHSAAGCRRRGRRLGLLLLAAKGSRTREHSSSHDNLVVAFCSRCYGLPDVARDATPQAREAEYKLGNLRTKSA